MFIQQIHIFVHKYTSIIRIGNNNLTELYCSFS